MSIAQILGSAGIILNTAGVVGPFRYGMPYRTRSGGAQYIVIEQVDETDIRKERLYDQWGMVSLAAIIGGALIQIAALFAQTR